MRFIGLGSWQASLWDISLTLISHSTGIFFISLRAPSTYHSAWDTGSVQSIFAELMGPGWRLMEGFLLCLGPELGLVAPALWAASLHQED